MLVEAYKDLCYCKISIGGVDFMLLEDRRNAGGVSEDASFYLTLDAELLTSTADMHLSNHYMYQHYRYRDVASIGFRDPNRP